MEKDGGGGGGRGGGGAGISFGDDDDPFSSLSSSIPSCPSSAPSPLVDFLRDLEIDGIRIMLGDRSPADADELAAVLSRAEKFLASKKPEEPAGLGSPLAASLQRLFGFEPGWGCTAGRALETMEQLSEILDAPAAEVVESFLGKRERRGKRFF